MFISKKKLNNLEKRIAGLEGQVQNKQNYILEMEKALKTIGWKGCSNSQVTQK